MRRLRSSGRARGYTLVALTIGITVMMILIAAVLPLASTQMKREKEEELIFRGRQYAEGIRAFRRKYGRYPTTLKEMFETRPRTLRKLWKDPITNSNDWGLITVGSLVPIGSQPGNRPGSTDGGSFGSGSFGGGSFGGGSFGGPSAKPTPAPSPTPDPFAGGRGTDGGGSTSGPGGPFGGGSTSGGDSPFGAKTGGDAPPMPITGVNSKSTAKSIRTYQGRDTYDGWQFTEASLTADSHGDNLQLAPGPGIPPGGGVAPPSGAPPRKF